MLKDWKFYFFLILLGIKLYQIGDSYEIEAINDVKLEKLRLKKAEFVANQKKELNLLYNKFLNVNRENCSLVYYKDTYSEIMAGFQTFIDRLSRDFHVKINRLDWGALQEDNRLFLIPFSISVEGKRENVKKFFCHLVNFEKVVSIDFFSERGYSKRVTVDMTGNLIKVKTEICEGIKRR